MFVQWVKVRTFKLKNNSSIDILVGHVHYKPMPEIRLDHGCTSQWPLFLGDRVVYDYPERVPEKVKKAVLKLYLEMQEANVEALAAG